MSISNHDFERILICASEANIADVHFHVGKPVTWERYCNLSPLKEYVPTAENMWMIFDRVADDETRELYVDGEDVTFRFDLEQWSFRVTAFRCNDKMSMSFHCLPHNYISLETLGKVSEIENFLPTSEKKDKGLIVLSGLPGSGTTSTANAILNKLSSLDLHIMTIEETSEINFARSTSAMISKRVSGNDFTSWSDSFKTAERTRAHVVYISYYLPQMLPQIIRLAKKCLVILNITANSVIDTIDTILDHKIGTWLSNSLADVLKAVQYQELFSNRKRGGLSAATELLINTRPVQINISAGDYDDLYCIMSHKDNMHTLEQSIASFEDKELML